MRHLYVDASALLRVLFREAGPRAPTGARMIWLSSRVVEVESHRALDRARFLGVLTEGELGVSGGQVRFFRPGADRPLPTRAERAEEERPRADRAEEENRRLREEIERLRRERSGS